MSFAGASLLTKIWQSGTPTNLRREFFENTYTKRRNSRFLVSFDNSQHKAGRQITYNWCGGVLLQVKVPWTNRNISNDQIITILKATFYPQTLLPFISEVYIF